MNPATASSIRVEPIWPVRLWQTLVRRVGWLGLLATVIVVIAAVPLVFVIYSSSQLSLPGWQSLWSVRLPGLLWNTLSLAVLVAIGCFLLGVSSAWFIARRYFVGRRLAIWLMILPLAIPTYVFAHIYTILLEEEGWLGRLWISVFGQAVAIPDIYSIGGVTFILSIAGFSYVFLLVRAALEHSNPSLEEAARIQGLSSFAVFWRVNLPLLRPAIAAGLSLVVLHVLSDFGAVSMLRYQTFTLSIYLQMNGRFDYQGAAGLSMVLVALSVMFLVLERWSRRRQRYYASASQPRKFHLRKATGIELVIIWAWLGLITLFAFALPVLWMLDWTLEAVRQDVIDITFWHFVLNSLIVAAAAASVAIVIAFPVAFFHARKHSGLSTSYIQLSSIGFVLPGPVIALGVLSFILAVLSPLYGGMVALLMALVIRFLPLAVQSQEAALQHLTPSIEQAGRILGAGPFENLRRVVLPMISNGMIVAWVLVFIDALKELPATLILRPTGFDTLPVRIWIEASEESLELAAPAALMLVIATLPALWLMMRKEKQTIINS